MIAVVILGYSSFARRIEEGVCEYAGAHDAARWGTLVSIPTDQVKARNLSSYRLDGMVAGIVSPAMLDRIRAVGVPLVNVSGSQQTTGFPSVLLDDLRIGRMAGEYFLERGYRHFAYMPTRHLPFFALERGRGYVEAVQRAGYPVSWFQETGGVPPGGAVPYAGTLFEWLRDLPKPVALFAAQDLLASELYRTAVALGLDVPEQVSILGVDNDSNAHFGTVGISSVEVPLRDVGLQAAEMLDRILDGVPLAHPTVRLPPLRVVSRTSSAAHAVDDPLVLEALRYIRQHAHTGIRVDDVVRAMPTSRRSLQRRFEAVLGSTITHEILQVRLHRAERLLLQTGLPVQEVAEACGFGDRNQFFVAFRSATGLSPRRFRAGDAARRPGPLDG
jgi:LacI family transcriptional regulator